jgi:Flp pilus assembly protein TadD
MRGLLLLCFIFNFICVSSQGIERNASYKVALEALGNREFSRAAVIFESLTEQFPKHSELWYNLGVAYFQQGMGALARNAFMQLADISPDFPKLATLLFRCGAMDKEWEFMKAFQERAIKEDSYEALYYRAAFAMRVGETESADADYRKALSIFPDFAPAAYDLGMSFFREGNLDSASKYLGSAYSIAHDNYKYMIGKSIALRYQGDQDGALSVLMRAQRFKPDNKLVLINLGLVCFELAQYEEALEFFLKAHQLYPDDSSVMLNVAAVFLMLGDDLNAMKFLAELNVPENLNGSLALNLGIAFENLFQEEKACRHFQKAFDLGVEKAGRYLRSQCE